MKTASKEFREKMNRGSQFYQTAKIIFADGRKKELDRKDFYISGNSCSDGPGTNAFPLGEAMAKQITMSLVNDDDRFSDYDFYLAEITVWLKCDLSETTESILMGTYTVTTPETYGAQVTVEASDDMYKGNEEYATELTYPATLAEILRDSCSSCGVNLLHTEFSNNTFEVQEKPEDITHRQLWGMIAMIAGGNARMNENNYLEMVEYDFSYFEKEGLDGGYFDTNNPYASGDSADGGNFTDWSSGDSADGGDFAELENFHFFYRAKTPTIATDDVVITGVQTTIDDTAYLFGSEGYVIKIENQLITEKPQEAVELIGSKIIGLKFRPFTMDHAAYPLAEFGDLCYIADRKGNVYQSVVTDVNFTFFGYTTISCAADDPLRNSSKYYSSSTEAILKGRRNTKKQLGAYDLAVQQLTNLITNSFGVFKTEEPLEDGSVIYYLHNKPELSSSSTIWKMTSDTFSVSTDGGKTWNAGMDSEGNAVVNVLNAIGINADWMITGQISDKTGKNYWNLDTGEMSIQAVSKLEEKAIASVDVMYALSDSTITAPTSGWSTTAPAWVSGKYMWQKTVITYADETTEETNATCISGATGQAGKDGVGIQSVTNYYLATSSTDVTTDTTGWTTKVQTISISKKYLWNYEVITYTDKTTATTTPCIIGTYGSTGATGNGIKSITEHYAVSSSNSTAPTSWSDTVPTLTAESKYLWNYETITYTNNETVDTSKRVIGVYGDKGNPGDNGVGIKSITNYYLATESSSGVTTGTSGWTTSIQTITASKKYLWNYEVTTYTNSTTSSTTPHIIGVYGATGATGATGNGISSITEYYAVSNSNSAAPTSWSTAVPAMTAANKYLWNYEKISYTNGNTADTSKRVIGVYGEDGENGVGIESIVEQYYLSSSDTAQANGSWSEDQPEWKEGYYIWTRSHIVWTNKTETYTAPVLAKAINGANQSVNDLNKNLNSEEIFNRLTDNGEIQGLFMKDGQLYINASYLYGGSITTSSFDIKGSVTKYADDYTEEDIDRVNSILLGEIEPTEEDYEKYDLNADGIISMADLMLCNRLYQKLIEYVTIDTSIKISAGDEKEVIKLQNVAIGANAVRAKTIVATSELYANMYHAKKADGSWAQSNITEASFTTADGKTVKVVGGIITNIL